jgi:hypothetical protein
MTLGVNEFMTAFCDVMRILDWTFLRIDVGVGRTDSRYVGELLFSLLKRRNSGVGGEQA